MRTAAAGWSASWRGGAEAGSTERPVALASTPWPGLFTIYSDYCLCSRRGAVESWGRGLFLLSTHTWLLPRARLLLAG